MRKLTVDVLTLDNSLASFKFAFDSTYFLFFAKKQPLQLNTPSIFKKVVNTQPDMLRKPKNKVFRIFWHFAAETYMEKQVW